MTVNDFNPIGEFRVKRLGDDDASDTPGLRRVSGQSVKPPGRGYSTSYTTLRKAIDTRFCSAVGFRMLHYIPHSMVGQLMGRTDWNCKILLIN